MNIVKIKASASTIKKAYNKAWNLFGLTESHHGHVLTSSALTVYMESSYAPDFDTDAKHLDTLVLKSSYYAPASLEEKARELAPKCEIIA